MMQYRIVAVGFESEAHAKKVAKAIKGLWPEVQVTATKRRLPKPKPKARPKPPILKL
jgi:hypothetical protein